MGNHRFRLSDMMPNAWFYKLRDMTIKTRSSQNPSSHPTKNTNMQQPLNQPRKSLYQTPEPTTRLYPSPKNHKSFDTHFPLDPPRRSSKKRARRRRTIYMPSPTQIRPPPVKPAGNAHFHDCIQDAPTSPDIPNFLTSALSGFQDTDSFHEPTSPGELSSPLSLSSPGSCKLNSSDIIIDVDETSYYKTIQINSLSDFGIISEPKLPPILTKPRPKRTATSPGPNRKSLSRSTGGVRIRGNGAKIASKKIETRRRKSFKGANKEMVYTGSFAVVKASFDPERDFRESMVEMIVENNIRVSEDLEDLLACYLSLNSDQYHGLIIKAFEQIWFNMPRSHVN